MTAKEKCRICGMPGQGICYKCSICSIEWHNERLPFLQRVQAGLEVYGRAEGKSVKKEEAEE